MVNIYPTKHCITAVSSLDMVSAKMLSFSSNSLIFKFKQAMLNIQKRFPDKANMLQWRISKVLEC